MKEEREKFYCYYEYAKLSLKIREIKDESESKWLDDVFK